MILERHPDNPVEARGMKAIGYWCNNHDTDLPNPLDYVDDKWDEAERAIVSQYLNNGKPTAYWRGWSCCRICGIRNGSCCLSDGAYVWPQGFAHYIEAHNVKPPKEFIEHVLNKSAVASDARWAKEMARREDEAGGFPGVSGRLTKIAGKITRCKLPHDR